MYKPPNALANADTRGRGTFLYPFVEFYVQVKTEKLFVTIDCPVSMPFVKTFLALRGTRSGAGLELLSTRPCLYAKVFFALGTLDILETTIPRVT
jgi:hypothetical protein